MLSSLSLFIVVAICVAAIGVVLAWSADRLGVAFRLERSVTGFIMLAAATSLPELVIGCQVARVGAVDMAIGSLLGSCLINLLILAMIDLSRRSRDRMLSRTAAAHALASLSSILLASFVALGVLVPGLPSLGTLHGASILLIVGYLLTVRMVYLDRCISAVADRIVSEPDAPIAIVGKTRPLLIYLASTIGILILASPLASTSGELSVILGLSGTFFGAAFLALITSLPEVVTTLQASRMEADDMAIGNILGSNAFNLLIIAAIDLVYEGPLFSVLTNVHAVAAVGIIVTTTVATMGLLYRVEKRVWYLEPDAIGVIVIATIFFYLLYIL